MHQERSPYKNPNMIFSERERKEEERMNNLSLMGIGKFI